MSAAESEPTDQVHPGDLTLFQLEILYQLATLRRPIGQDINEALNDYYGKDINHGRLYPNLQDLADSGLVNKDDRDGRSVYFTLTRAGQELLRRDAQRRSDIADSLTIRGEE